MNQRAIIVAVVLFIVIVLGMFAYARMKSAEVNKVEPLPETPQKEEYAEIERIDAKHYFKDGTHTVAGEIMMPTPCDLLESRAVKTATSSPDYPYPDQIGLEFTVINYTGAVCAQVITPQRFKVSFEAGEDALIGATFKGEKVMLNFVEAGPDENPDDFELFQKG